MSHQCLLGCLIISEEGEILSDFMCMNFTGVCQKVKYIVNSFLKMSRRVIGYVMYLMTFIYYTLWDIIILYETIY